MPAERDLAAKLGVSRASLAQALVALEVQGVLSVRHGDGAILVRRPPKNGPSRRCANTPTAFQTSSRRAKPW
jgi:GntR family transcriptional regulator, transcriptional repressor for pyruvate dehydrogenase complex